LRALQSAAQSARLSIPAVLIITAHPGLLKQAVFGAYAGTIAATITVGAKFTLE
jgi:hypothetical protein